MPLEKLWLLQPTLEHRWRDCNSTHTQAHIVKQTSFFHASFKWEGAGTPSSKWTGLCKFSFYFTWSLLLCNGYQFCSSNVWILQHHSVHALDMRIIIVLYIWGCSSNDISLAQTTLVIPVVYIRGCLLGKWPDLMISKPDSVSTLGYHLAEYIVATLADAIIQWCPSGNPVLMCINGTHWKTTGRPLEDHWKHTGYQQFLLQWHSSVHWGLNSRQTGLPLDYHWITTGPG